MQTLTLKVYNNDTLSKNIKNINYIDKLNTLYFSIDNTKYYLNYKKETLRYVTEEESVTINFSTNIINIKLLKYNYSLEMIILKSKFINKNKEYIIEYILKEDMIKRTIIISLN